MPDVKVSGIPPDTGLDDNHYVILNDPTGPTTKTTTLGVLRLWLQSVATWVKSSMMDYSTMSLNMKHASNAGTINPATTGDTNFSTSLQCTFTVAAACNAEVRLDIGLSSTSDFEFGPIIYLDGAVFERFTPSAGAGNASNRASYRGFSSVVPLTAGAHTISGGVGLSSSTAPAIAAGGAKLTVLVLGNVTA